MRRTNISLPEGVLARSRAEARARGVSLDTLVRQALEGLLAGARSQASTWSERAASGGGVPDSGRPNHAESLYYDDE